MLSSVQKLLTKLGLGKQSKGFETLSKGRNWGFVSLKVYDILRNEVATLVNEKQDAGSYSATFDGSDLPSGIYFYKLFINGIQLIRRGWRF